MHAGGPRVAVVTGGSGGIGHSICLEMARSGWDICLAYHSNEDQAHEIIDQVHALGRGGLAVQVDVGSSSNVAALFETSRAKLGSLGALVNNAGIIGTPRSILDADDAHLSNVFRINVLSSFFCVREAGRQMSRLRGGDGGVIVNVSSAAARHGGMPDEAHYASSKGAIDSLTLSLARELAPHGIRVNAVRPGLIVTDIHAVHGGQTLIDRVAGSIPLGRAGTPEEVAEVVDFLCSSKSSYVHGALIDIGGGR